MWAAPSVPTARPLVWHTQCVDGRGYLTNVSGHWWGPIHFPSAFSLHTAETSTCVKLQQLRRRALKNNPCIFGECISSICTHYRLRHTRTDTHMHTQLWLIFDHTCVNHDIEFKRFSATSCLYIPTSTSQLGLNIFREDWMAWQPPKLEVTFFWKRISTILKYKRVKPYTI